MAVARWQPTAEAEKGWGEPPEGVVRESGAARTRDTNKVDLTSKAHEEEGTLSLLLGSGTAPHGQLAVRRM